MGSNYGIAPQLNLNSQYEIRLDLTQAVIADYTLTIPNSSGNTSNNNTTDLNDSDGLPRGDVAVISVTLGATRENNHTLDFGLTTPTAAIEIGLDGVNWVGDPHTFTITTTWTPVITPNNLIITPTVSPVPNSQSDTCATPVIGTGVATCTLTINHNLAEVFTATAQALVSLPSITQTVTTDGVGNNSDGGTKVYRIFDLALQKRLAPGQSGPIYPGDDITYTVTIFNQGTVTATNIGVVDYLPTGFSLSPNDSNGWTGTGSNVTTTVARPVSPGLSTTINIVVQVGNSVAAGNHVNFAEISGAEDENGDPAPDIDSTPDSNDGNDGPVTDDDINNSNGDEDDHDPATVTIEIFDLALRKQLTPGQPTIIQPGDTITYTSPSSTRGR